LHNSNISLTNKNLTNSNDNFDSKKYDIEKNFKTNSLNIRKLNKYEKHYENNDTISLNVDFSYEETEYENFYDSSISRILSKSNKTMSQSKNKIK
jgi:hypothetical protein